MKTVKNIFTTLISVIFMFIPFVLVGFIFVFLSKKFGIDYKPILMLFLSVVGISIVIGIINNISARFVKNISEEEFVSAFSNAGYKVSVVEPNEDTESSGLVKMYSVDFESEHVMQLAIFKNDECAFYNFKQNLSEIKAKLGMEDNGNASGIQQSTDNEKSVYESNNKNKNYFKLVYANGLCFRLQRINNQLIYTTISDDIISKVKKEP